MALEPLNALEWSLGNYEVGHVCGTFKCGKHKIYSMSSNGTLRLNIPKLMPKVPIEAPVAKPKPVGLSDACFINDKACKPAVAKMITTQSWLTVPPLANRQFKEGLFHHGTKVLVEIRNDNPDTIFVSTKEDNSHKD